MASASEGGACHSSYQLYIDRCFYTLIGVFDGKYYFRNILYICDRLLFGIHYNI